MVDLYYMPYTHSLVAALLWSLGMALLYRLIAARSSNRSAVVLGLAVLSHWLLDLIVHRPDLSLYDDTAKVGLGLWNLPAIAFGLEALLLLAGIALCVEKGLVKTRGAVIFGIAMLAIHAQVFFGAPPPSANAAALTALAAYFAFAGIIHFVERHGDESRTRQVAAVPTLGLAQK